MVDARRAIKDALKDWWLTREPDEQPSDDLVSEILGGITLANLAAAIQGRGADKSVDVIVTGLTGTGKSAVLAEIEVALRAVGLEVTYAPGVDADRGLSHVDWIDLYKPKIVLHEVNMPRPAPHETEHG